MSISNKRIILTQECLRIILNCNTHIGWKKLAEHLTFFMSRMQASGYDHQFRLEILKSAMNAHDKIRLRERSVKGRKYIEGENGGGMKEDRKGRNERRIGIVKVDASR